MTTDQFNALVVALRDVMDKATPRQDAAVLEADDREQTLRLPLPRNAKYPIPMRGVEIDADKFDARRLAEEAYATYRVAFRTADGLPLVRCVGGPADGLDIPLAEHENSYTHIAGGVRHQYRRVRDADTRASTLRSAESPGHRL